jgi:hypothetical protein
MKTLRIVLVLALSIFVLNACASDGGSSGSEGSASKTSSGNYPAGYSAPPGDTKFAEVQINSTEYEVRKILGEPDRANAYMTGKAWIPFYFGSDVARTDWFYTGQGRVVFSRNRYTGALKVIRVLYSAEEP